MRTRSFVFPPILLVLTLFVPNMVHAESSLIQPAFAYSEDSRVNPSIGIPPLVNLPDREQIDLIQLVSDDVILSSEVMESDDILAEHEDYELGNGSFINAPQEQANPHRSWSAPTPSSCGSPACESVTCEACGPASWTYAPYDSCESICDCTDYGMSSNFNLFAPNCKGKNPFFMNAWVSAGITLPSGSSNREVEALSRFPDVYDKFMMNQLYLAIGRNVNPHGNSFDLGGRLDLLYGTDYYFTSAFGLETETTFPAGRPLWNQDPKNADARWNSSDGPRNWNCASLYGLSMPQLYGEFFAPIGLGTTVKAGHFYSMMGYESPMAPENFFYSHTWSMTHGQPMTFTGVVVNQQLTRGLTGFLGYTNGWDIWENPRGSISLLAGFKWSSRDQNSELAFTIHSGNDRADVHSPYRDGDRTNYSLVYSQRLSHRWRWAIQHDLGLEKNVNQKIIYGNPSFVDGRWASIVNYLYYTINDKWSVGGRFEWFQDSHHSRIGNLYPYERKMNYPGIDFWTTGQNYYNFSLGLNWKPIPRMTLRPEIRWDWSDVERHVDIGPTGTPDISAGMFNDFQKKNLLTIGLEGYIKF